MALEAALERWAQSEMGLGPPARPPRAVLRRLCLGPGAPIWDFITRHVRHPRAQGAGPATPLGAVRESVSQLREEVECLGRALREAQGAGLELEEKLWAELEQRRAELRRGLELRVMGAESARRGRGLRRGLEVLSPPGGLEGVGPAELGVALALGMEPEVLVSVRAVCSSRAEALEALLEPRPSLEAQQLLKAADERWLQAAEALLSHHPPQALLWALELLAQESARRRMPEPDLDPEGDPKAPPTVKELIQESWGAVGEVWGRMPHLAQRLHPMRLRLLRLHQELSHRLGGDPKTLRAARLALKAAGLEGARRALVGGVQELGGGRGPPKPPLHEQWQQLQQERKRVNWRQRRLRAMAEANTTLGGRLNPLKAQVQRVGLEGVGRSLPTLLGEGQRLQRLLGEMGGIGTAPPGPAPPDPLLPICRTLGVPLHEGSRGALPRAAALRQELRELRRRAGLNEGAWPPQGAWPNLSPSRVRGAVGVANAELLPCLRLVAARTRECIQDWPRLQELVSQWWEQPAQWLLATPPGSSAPFSYWLHRWSQAAQSLAPSCPRPLPPAPPTREGRGQGKPRP
ncbi:HAUS augmin-like complex subunit 5 [Podargus strigoides]